MFYDAWRCRITIPEQMPVIAAMKLGRGEFDVKTRGWKVPCERRPWPGPIAYQFIEDAGSGEGILQQATADGVPLMALPTEGKSKEVACLRRSRNSRLRTS